MWFEGYTRRHVFSLISCVCRQVKRMFTISNELLGLSKYG